MRVEKAAKGMIKGGNVSEGLLNMVEMAFRAYDPSHSRLEMSQKLWHRRHSNQRERSIASSRGFLAGEFGRTLAAYPG